jgi:hypothetical protein
MELAQRAAIATLGRDSASFDVAATAKNHEAPGRQSNAAAAPANEFGHGWPDMITELLTSASNSAWARAERSRPLITFRTARSRFRVRT